VVSEKCRFTKIADAFLQKRLKASNIKTEGEALGIKTHGHQCSVPALQAGILVWGRLVKQPLPVSLLFQPFRLMRFSGWKLE
jgi:hypothetical protein